MNDSSERMAESDTSAEESRTLIADAVRAHIDRFQRTTAARVDQLASMVGLDKTERLLDNLVQEQSRPPQQRDAEKTRWIASFMAEMDRLTADAPWRKRQRHAERLQEHTRRSNKRRHAEREQRRQRVEELAAELRAKIPTWKDSDIIRRIHSTHPELGKPRTLREHLKELRR